MQVSIEETSALARRMTVGIPKERIQEEVKTRLKKLARTTKLNGFRPGKVPLRVVEQRFGDQIKQEVVGEVVQQSFYEAVEQESLQLAGDPQIDLDSDIQNLDEGLSYIAEFEVIPSFSEIVIDGLAVEKQVAEVQDSDVDNMVEKLREQRRIWEAVEDGAAEGCRVTIDAAVSVDGNEIEEAGLNGFQFILGSSGIIIEGFEAAITGAKADEAVEIDLKYPDEYDAIPELQGKDAHFSIHVNTVEQGQLPEIDEDFAKALGVETGEIDSLRQDVRENMSRELSYTLKTKAKQQTLDALLEANPSDVPENLIKGEAQRMAENFQREMQGHGSAAGQVDSSHFNEQAEKRVKLGLLMGELVRQNDMQPNANKVREMLERIASAYEEPETVIDWYYSDAKRLADVESMVLEEQVVDWLLEKADISEMESTFEAIMNPAQ
ncbi:MAG: trigger factor [Thiotrichaceae bacterium]|nr:trigger factor [Thiotrichaceae bacterium]